VIRLSYRAITPHAAAADAAASQMYWEFSADCRGV
jgi:hypothetical protein